MKHGHPTALRVAIALSIALFAWSSRQWIAVGVLVAFWLVGLTRLRVEADRMLQLALGLMSLAASWLLTTVIALPVDSRTIAVLQPIGRFVSFALLLTTVARLMFESAWGGVRASASLVLLALLFLADGQFDLTYIAISLLVLACLWHALWASEPARPGWGDMDQRLRVMTGVTCVIASGIAINCALVIPAIYPWMAGLVLDLVDESSASTGFSTTMTLGAVSGMRDNDARVLRVHGEYVDHLRGIAYDEYRYGRWMQSEEPVLRRVELAPDRNDARMKHARMTEIETVGGDPMRYFVPLIASSLAVDGNAARVDSSGNLQALASTRAKGIRFHASERDRFAPAEPRPVDVQVPAEVAPLLQKLATTWTAGATGAAARLAALSNHLSGTYHYSLEFERSKGIDPVVDFLTVHRQGHCEYFASAFALLARSLGIPARVIGGYRVAEHNELGGYYVVREQHAHAWVEAWEPGLGWTTYDPTPASGLPLAGKTTPLLPGMLDFAGHVLSKLIDGIGPDDLYALAGLLFAGWIAMRVVRALRERKVRGGPSALHPEPAPSLSELLQALARSGHPRAAHEPLERYATRLEAEPALARTAVVLHRYSAYRYGGHGDIDALEAELRRATESLGLTRSP